MMKKKCPVIVMFIVLVSGMLGGGIVQAQALAAKSPLKILFVGYDPARVPQEFRKGLDEFTAKDSIRMPAFRELLRRYFAEVQTKDCRDWKPADSGPYDVTIFDYKTTPIEKGNDYDVADRYLPDNFSKPVVFIGSTADIMGRRIGLKLDWLCLCLDADAHHINTAHAIFKGPLENVVPTLEMEKTPDNIYEYPSGDTVPKKIPMWKVQTLSYMNDDHTSMKDDHARIGLVSRGARFMDSPDAEVISSGVCAKDVTAVALGRHGNFFLWGFSASPANMTEEAKKVFVNTVAYMKQFDGQTPIARKYNDRMATTDDIRNIMQWSTKKYWQLSNEETKKFNEQTKVQLKKLEDKKAAGVALTDNETQMLTMFRTSPPAPAKAWEAYLKGMMGPLAGRFGSDAPAFQKYLKDNIDFMYCDPKGFFSYKVDEDVKKLNIPNHSIRLIETCIKMLKENKDPELALRVLKRYTPEDFKTAEEWEAWYDQNKDRLFFTETGGYKFLVNSLKG